MYRVHKATQGVESGYDNMWFPFGKREFSCPTSPPGRSFLHSFHRFPRSCHHRNSRNHLKQTMNSERPTDSITLVKKIKGILIHQFMTCLKSDEYFKYIVNSFRLTNRTLLLEWQIIRWVKQGKLTLIASKTSVASSVASTTVAKNVGTPNDLAVIPGPKATRESTEEE